MRKIWNISASLLFIISSGAVALQKSQSSLNTTGLVTDIANESFTKDATTASAAGFNSDVWKTTTLIDAIYRADSQDRYTMLINSSLQTSSAFEGSGFDYFQVNPWLGDRNIQMNRGYNIHVVLASFNGYVKRPIGYAYVGSLELYLDVNFNNYDEMEVKLTAFTRANAVTAFGWAKAYSTYGINYRIY